MDPRWDGDGGAAAPGGNVLVALQDQQDEFAALLDPLDEPACSSPSRCAGWTIGDVVLHLAQTNEMAVASGAGELPGHLDALLAGLDVAADVEAGAGALVALERGAPPSALLERWRRSAERQVETFAALDPHARLQWVAGELAARSLATTRLCECWIHTGDVAAGLGIEVVPTSRLWHVARLAWRTVPYAVTSAGATLRGPVEFDLRAPDGSVWRFGPDDGAAATVVRGDAFELCEVAGRRRSAADTNLTGAGPDLDLVLRVVRTFA